MIDLVKDFGVDPFGKEDAGAAINAAIAAIGQGWIGTQIEARKIDFYLQPGSYRFATPVVFPNMMGGRFYGAGKGATCGYWDGPSAPSFVELRDCCNFTMGEMLLKAAANLDDPAAPVRKLGAMVQIHRTGNTYSFGERNVGYGNWCNRLENLILGGDARPNFGIGVQIRSEVDGNNDFHCLTGVEINGYLNAVGQGTEACLSLEGTQAVGQRMEHCRFIGGKRGVSNLVGWPPSFRGGTASWVGGAMGHHTVSDFDIGPCFLGWTIRDMISEGSARLLQVPGPNNNAMPITIEGGSWAAYGMAPSDAAFILMGSPGPLTIRGLTYGGGHPAGISPIVRLNSVNAILEMTGNAHRGIGSASQWPVTAYSAGPGNNNRMNVYGNLGLDPAGAEVPMREIRTS